MTRLESGTGSDHAATRALPPGLLFGTATSAYQIEGRAADRGTTVWDTFCRQPGNIRDGSDGDVACEHLDRMTEDLDLLAGLGVDAYRFSVAWSRVQPDGTGRPSEQGLAVYDRLVDGLLERGIRPYTTLFHWDLPQALEDDGGWLNRTTAERFAEYAELVADRIGDRVDTWITLNEPYCHTHLGYGTGVHAPGHRLFGAAFDTAHHQLLGHALAAPRLRGHAPVAVANSYSTAWPASPSGEDAAAARLQEAWHNAVYTDPLLLGRYPDEIERVPGVSLDCVRDGDLSLMRGSLDVLGVNYYTLNRVGAPMPGAAWPWTEHGLPEREHTSIGWPIVPEGLPEMLRWLRNRYGDLLPPLVVTENGCCYEDEPVAGQIHDDDRIRYVGAHLRALADATAEGIAVRGYFYWSLLDNFEWADGYTRRFGLVHVDFATQQRTPKRSYWWLREQLATHRQRREGLPYPASTSAEGSRSPQGG
ncbi:GH1 family beta-glucosidase [Micromonospora sp. NPDC048830]|uniref:GH1 family beta-glucosidase n=1 Tax=Micromonospora sp. NPDC048830 TaxID=3364257 RepID=UPI00372043FA